MGMSEEYISIETGLMREAVDCVVPYLPYSRTNKENSIKTHDYSVKFVEALVEEIEGAELFCDHSVGICACGEIALVEDLRLRLDGKRRCPECHGDGYAWNEKEWKENIQKYMKEWGISEAQARRDIGDDPGYEKCKNCNGKGVVEYDGSAKDH